MCLTVHTDSKRSKKKKKGKGDALQEESAGGVEPPDKVEAGPSSTAEAAPDVPVEAEEEDAAETEADGKVGAQIQTSYILICIIQSYRIFL